MHALQGLDVVCFARMKDAWKEEINMFEDLQKRAVGKGDYTEVFGMAFLRAFTLETVKATFEATGIVPFNPDMIKESQLKPSLMTSTKASFPLPQTSPVCAVISALRANLPTSFDLSPSTHAPAHMPSLPSPAPLLFPILPSDIPSPSTPTWQKRLSPLNFIDPALYTPSKLVRLLSAAIGAMRSGSFLVCKAHIKSNQVVAEPVLEATPTIPESDWLLLEQPVNLLTCTAMTEHIRQLTDSLHLVQQHITTRELISEANNAQLVVQHLHLDQLNQALHKKENKVDDDCTR